MRRVVFLLLALILIGPKTAFPARTSGKLAVKAVMVTEFGTGRVLYSQDPDRRIAPASVTKIMTMYLVFDALASGQAHLGDRVRVSYRADTTGGSTMGLRAGETVSLDELMQGMAVASGNDACIAIAEHFGGIPQFVSMMNRKAQELGMTSTTFVNPNGLPARRSAHHRPGPHQAGHQLPAALSPSPALPLHHRDQPPGRHPRQQQPPARSRGGCGRHQDRVRRVERLQHRGHGQTRRYPDHRRGPRRTHQAGAQPRGHPHPGSLLLRFGEFDDGGQRRQRRRRSAPKDQPPQGRPAPWQKDTRRRKHAPPGQGQRPSWRLGPVRHRRGQSLTLPPQDRLFPQKRNPSPFLVPAPRQNRRLEQLARRRERGEDASGGRDRTPGWRDAPPGPLRRKTKIVPKEERPLEKG